MKYLTIISNIVYPLVGWYGDWITFTAGLILGIGSAIMHYQEEYTERKEWSILLDWFGMYVFTLSILGFLSTYWVLLLLIPLGYIKNDMRDNNLIGLLVGLLCLLTGSFWALGLFIIAVVIRFKYEETEWQDYSHSLWHLLTALSYYLVLQGIN